MTFIDDIARGWRDIANQLTGQQRAELAALEVKGDEPATLLFTARDMAAENMTDSVMFGHVEKPPDAVRVYGWREHGAGWSREFHGAPAIIGHAKLWITGRQFGDGRCERGVMLESDDNAALTTAQVRELAAALIDAADRCEPRC